MILTPKRKLITNTPVDEALLAMLDHTQETVINELETSNRAFTNIGKFDHRLKIPVGTDMYPQDVIVSGDAYITGDDSSISIWESDYWGAQTFTPTVSHTITSVKLLLYRVLSPGTVTVAIRKTSADKPSGADLCSGTTTGNDLPTGSPYEWREIDFGAGTALTANKKYAIIVRVGVDADVNNYVRWRGDSGDGAYAGGNATISTDNGETWSTAAVTGWDLMFWDWGEVVSIKEGYIWMEGSNLQGFDENAVERTYIHTADVDDTPVDAATTDPISSNWAYDHAVAFNDHSARHEDGGADELVLYSDQVEVSELSAATYDDVQDYINFFGDRTLLSGGGISARADALTGVNTGGAGSASFEISGDLTATYKEDDIITVSGSSANDGNYTLKADSTHAGGTTTITVDEAVSDATVNGSIYGAANVASGTAWAKATDADAAVGKFFNFSADNTVTLTNLLTNYVYLDYNGGAPQMAVSTSITTLGFKQDHIHIATMFRNGATLHYHEEDAIGIGRINIADMHFLEMHDADRASGLITTDAGSRALNVSAGVIYEGLNRHTTAAQIPASWSTWWTADSGSTWTEVTGQSTIDNAQYNDVTSGLESLTSNRYAVHWLYVDIDGANLFIIYGQDDYTINGAEEAGVPTYLPDIAVHYGVLIAKIIVQEGQTSLEILYPWTTTIHSSKSTDHGNLAGLGDDDHAIYLLAAGSRALAGAWDMGSQAITNIDINSGTIAGVTIDGDLTWSSAQSGLTLTAPTLNGTTTLGSTPIFDAGSGDAQINTTGADKGLVIISTSNASEGVTLLTQHISATPAISDVIYRHHIYGKNSTPASFVYAKYNTVIVTPTAASEDAKQEWYLANGGALNLAMTLTGPGDLWVDGSITLDANETVDGVDVSAHDANTTTVHGAVSAATASKIVVRDAEGQAKFAAPAASGDALIKGTRVTTAELPAMTDEKIWKGTGASVEEVDLVHGAAQHTDITREVFLQATAGHMSAGNSGATGQHSDVYGGADLNEPAVYFSMKVPDDFVSFTSVKAVWATTEADGNMYWKLLADYGASGEQATVHTDDPAIGTTANGGAVILNVQEPANPLTLADLAAGDYLGISFTRTGSNASDTIDGIVRLLGLLFTYVAEQ